MIKKIALYFSVLLLLSCAIEEIPRQPLLSTPLGLKVKIAPAVGGGNALGLFFTANNPEIYFTGYAIYVSPQISDFQSFSDSFFPLKPTDVSGSKAQLLKRYDIPTDENLTIWVGGAMSFPERRFYPPDATTDNRPPENPAFTLSSFKTLPDGTLFTVGTTYYFAAYAYSAVDSAYSLPSNIASVIPNP